MTQSKERFAATLAREEVDRPPVTLWRHNFLREWSAADLADETLSLYRRFDWDLIKLNSRWSYLPEAFGNRYEPPREQRFQRQTHGVIQTAADLDRLEPADRNHPSLVEQLDALETVVREVGDEVDIIHTVFSPLSVVGLIAGGIGQPLLTLAKENPEGLDRALLIVRETVAAHITDSLDRGAAGIFYAPLQWTSLDLCDAAFYERFGRPHDLWVLKRAQEARVIALHMCGNQIAAERFLDYPVNLLSWDDRGPGNPTIADLAKDSGRAVMAGVPHKRIHKMSDDELATAIRESIDGVDRGVVLAGGCAVGALLADDRMRAARDLAAEMA